MVIVIYEFNRPVMKKDGVTVDDLLSDFRQYGKEIGGTNEAYDGVFSIEGGDETRLPSFAKNHLREHPETLRYIENLSELYLEEACDDAGNKFVKKVTGGGIILEGKYCPERKLFLSDIRSA